MLPSIGFAQKKSTLKDRWRNSIGASVHLLHVSENVSPAFGIFYNPQINIINKYADFSLAATLPVTLGAHVKDSWIEETFFYAHVPAVLEASLGHYSTRDFRSNIGVALGAGYGAQIAGSSVSTGFVATVAARTWIVRGYKPGVCEWVGGCEELSNFIPPQHTHLHTQHVIQIAN